MKSFGKVIFILIAALSIFVFVLGAFGIAEHYGDITTVIVKSAEQLGIGLDGSTNMKIVLSPSEEGKTLSREEMLYTKSILEKRLDSYLIDEYRINCDFENSTFSVVLAYNNSSQYTSSWVVAQLTSVGDVKVYEGDAVDESKVIISSENITSAEVFREMLSDTYARYGVEMSLNAEGREAYKAAMDKLLAEKTDTSVSTVSIYIDGQSVASMGINEEFKGRNAIIKSSMLSYETAAAATIIIDSGKLPVELKNTSITLMNASIGEQAITALQLAVISALAISFFYLIYKYRLCGVASMISMLGTVGGLLLVCTGMFTITSPNSVIPLTATAMAAAFITIFINYEANVRYFESIKARLGEVSPNKAIVEEFKKTVGTTLGIDFALVLISLLFYIFVRNQGIHSFILSPIFAAFGVKTVNFSSFTYFGIMLLAGTLIGFLSSVLGTFASLYSLSCFKFASNKKLFGGER